MFYDELNQAQTADWNKKEKEKKDRTKVTSSFYLYSNVDIFKDYFYFYSKIEMVSGTKRPTK